MKFLKWILIGGALAYLAIASFLYFNQRSLLYFPPSIYVTPQTAGIDMREVKHQSFISWYKAPETDTAPVIMFFHGNGSAIYSNSDIFADLTAQGYGVLSVGYPGYPGSVGKPTQGNIVRAAKFQRDWLKSEGIGVSRIVYFGTSLGSGIAAQLTALDPPALLVMEAPFNSTLDMAKMHLPFLPHSILMKDKFRSDKALQNYDGPMIWMHGTKDGVVPFAQGQKLYDGYDGPKSAHVFEGGRHTNLWGLGGRDIVLARLALIFPASPANLLPQDHADVEGGEQ
ncbi:MAG: alpha/beta fold hydrolase [Maricaulaceae bacterium]